MGFTEIKFYPFAPFLSSLSPHFFHCWNNIPCLVLPFTISSQNGGAEGQCILLSICKAWHKFTVLHAQYLINMWFHKINNSYPCQGAHLAENLDSGPDGVCIMKSLCYANFDRNAQALYFDTLYRNFFWLVLLFPVQ